MSDFDTPDDIPTGDDDDIDSDHDRFYRGDEPGDDVPSGDAGSPLAGEPEQAPFDFDDSELEPWTVPGDIEPLSLPGAEEWAPNGFLVLDLEGTRYQLGLPTLDLDGDGTPDSTIVGGADGTQYLVTDLTGEGAADGLVLLDAGGNVLYGFEIDGEGNPSPFEVPEGLNLADLVPGGTSPGAADAGIADTGAVAPLAVVPEAAAAPAGSVPESAGRPIGLAPDIAFPAGGATIDPSAAGEPSDAFGGIGGNVVLEADPGEWIDLGPATHDFDGDGINESVVVRGPDGRPAYVVSEAGFDGHGDVVLTLDPDTMQVVEVLSYHKGELVQQADDDSAGDDEGTAPTGSPEKIIAPGTGSNPLVGSSTQQMYDIASQVWFDLTDGKPYPRDESGQPLNPGMVFATLADMPGMPESTVRDLKDLADSWLRSISVWTNPK